MRMESLKFIIKKTRYVIFFTIFFLLIYYAVNTFTLQSQSTDDAYISGDIVPVYSTVNGFIKDVSYDFGDTITAGQSIVSLNENDFIYALELNRLNVIQSLTDYRLKKIDKEILENTVKSSTLTVNNSIKSLERRNTLVSRDMYSKEEYESDNIKNEKNIITLNNDKEQILRIEQELGDGIAKNNLQIRIALQKLKQSYFSYVRSRVCSPVSGVIAKKYIQPGSYVTPSQKLYDVISDNRWVEANFRETQIKELRIGQQVDITSDVLGSNTLLKGYIYSIGSGAGSVLSIIPPQNATGNWTKVVQRVPVKILFINDIVADRLPLGTSVRVQFKNQTKDNVKETVNTLKVPKNPCYTDIDSLYRQEEENLFSYIDTRN